MISAVRGFHGARRVAQEARFAMFGKQGANSDTLKTRYGIISSLALQSPEGSKIGGKMDLKDYILDPRQRFVLSVIGQRVRKDISCMYLLAVDLISAQDWHWLKYHFSQYPPHPVGLALARVKTH
ncbi:hypothetical protein [Rhodobacter viridis]|uniref:hypothetical protein n=1 Tax=Rhodobacter viridis TaxID=1054202 RepID=UPI0011B6D7CB|nr:hypothetical protein [Rhodobacter viridis]